MSKFIKLERRELVWQWRTNTFGEKEWNEEKEYYKNTQTRSSYMDGVYEKIKDISWDEAFNAWVRYNRGEETDHEIRIGEKTWGPQDRGQTLGSFIEDIVRERNYQSEIDCEDYADDYEEEWDEGDE